MREGDRTRESRVKGREGGIQRVLKEFSTSKISFLLSSYRVNKRKEIVLVFPNIIIHIQPIHSWQITITIHIHAIIHSNNIHDIHQYV